MSQAMECKGAEAVDDGVLLTKPTFLKLTNITLGLSFISVILIIVQHISPFSWWSFDTLAWAKSRPLRIPFVSLLIIHRILLWIGFGSATSFYNRNQGFPFVVIARPKIVTDYVKVIVQWLAVITTILFIYVVVIAIFMEFFALIKN